MTSATEITNPAGVGCPVVEQESVEQPLVSKNVGGGGQYFDIISSSSSLSLLRAHEGWSNGTNGT